jgi:hypothetical protein
MGDGERKRVGKRDRKGVRIRLLRVGDVESD